MHARRRLTLAALSSCTALLLAMLLTALVAPLPSTAATRGAGASATPGTPAQLVVREVPFAGSRLTLAFDAADLKLTEDDIVDWVRRSARAVTTYFGKFPAAEVHIVLQAAAGDEVTEGVAWASPGARIRITVGRRTTRDTLKRDTTLVHEMTHLAFPDLDDTYLWLHEGIATYVENIASAQAGEMTPAALWAEFAREMPQGLPERGDTGLNATSSDDRRYWGGALFCLMADVEIRRRTSNRFGLRDALRAVLSAGGTLAHTWEVERALAIADKAVGVPALSELFATWQSRAVTPDLDKLWREMGVERAWLSLRHAGGVRFADTAPLAAIRRAITEPPAKPMLLVAPSLVRETVRRP